MLRDRRFEAWQWLQDRHLARLRAAKLAYLPVPILVVGHDGSGDLVSDPTGSKMLTALGVPTDASARGEVAMVLTAVFSRERFDPLTTEETDGVLLVASSVYSISRRRENGPPVIAATQSPRQRRPLSRKFSLTGLCGPSCAHIQQEAWLAAAVELLSQAKGSRVIAERHPVVRLRHRLE